MRWAFGVSGTESTTEDRYLGKQGGKASYRLHFDERLATCMQPWVNPRSSRAILGGV